MRRDLNAFPIRALFIWSRGSFRECRGITTKRSLLSKRYQRGPMFPSNYYRAAQFYAYSTSKVWSQIYGEIMMNLLPSGDRNKEMSELLFRNYKTGIVFSTDSVSVDFTRTVRSP